MDTNDYTELHSMVKWARANNIILPQDLYDLYDMAERLMAGVRTMARNKTMNRPGLGIGGAYEAVHKLAQYVAAKEATR
jgi:hypothetical protein